MSDKEVYFYEYCPKCSFYRNDEEDYPCGQCLSIPSRIDSHKPEYFKEAGDEATKTTKAKHPSKIA